MFERFTDRARRVLVIAQDEARRLHHSAIGTEHILLGLLSQPDSVAAKALAAREISSAAVRAKVEELAPRGEALPTESPPFTPRAKKVLELSLREALQFGHNYIGTEHLLLGLLREEEGLAAQALRASGADLEELRDEIGRQLGALPHGRRQGVVMRPAGPPPHCPQCHEPLESRLRYRVLEATAEDAGEPARITVAYCGACGSAITGSILINGPD